MESIVINGAKIIATAFIFKNYERRTNYCFHFCCIVSLKVHFPKQLINECN